jgi:hypothetical protein
MAIRLKERAEFEDFEVFQAGNMTAATIYIAVAPFPLVLKGVLARVRTAGTTGTANIDVRINNTSVFASGSTAIQFASASTTPTYGAMGTTNPPTLNKGDILTVVVTAVHTTPAVDTVLAINLVRPRGGQYPCAMLTDSISEGE